MNRMDEWTEVISKCLKAETELLGLQAKHDLYEDAARATFIRVVLEQFLPSSFAIGSGRVIDASGDRSNELDIVIYRRDFPQLNLPGSTNVFLYESVLATIEVKTKLVRKTFFEAMDNCASMGDLNPAVNPVTIRRLALKNQLYLNENNDYMHEDPMKTARFNLIGRPPSFVYAFSGYQTSLKQLKENIDLWIDYRRKKRLNYEMKSFPATIATQGCFAWRNAAPFSLKKNFMLGLGNDSAPLRLIILQLMNALNRRLRGANVDSGVNLNLDAYINHMELPKFSSSCGKVINPGAPTTTVTPIAREDVPAPVEIKPVSKPTPKKAEPTPVKTRVVSEPIAEKVEPAPVAIKAVSEPTPEKAPPAPVKEEPVSAPVAKKSSESSSTLETYAVFNTPTTSPEEEPVHAAAPESKAANASNPIPEEQAVDEPEFIEPELAQPEFIETEIIEPEPKIDLNTKPVPGPNPLEDTAKMPTAEVPRSSTPSPVESKPEPPRQDKSASEKDLFSETIRMPTHELENISTSKQSAESESAKKSKPQAENGQVHVSESDPDPFSRTIPQ